MQDRWQQMQKEVHDPDLPDKAEFEAEKEEITSELREIRAELEERIVEIEKELADLELDPEKRSEHEQVRNEFQRQLHSTRQHLAEVEKAGRREWSEVRESTDDLLKEVEMLYDNEGFDRERTMETNEDLDLNRNAEEVR